MCTLTHLCGTWFGGQFAASWGTRWDVGGGTRWRPAVWTEAGGRLDGVSRRDDAWDVWPKEGVHGLWLVPLRGGGH